MSTGLVTFVDGAPGIADQTSDANGVMSGCVAVFSTAGERDLVLPNPALGQVAYLRTEHTTYIYRAGGWEATEKHRTAVTLALSGVSGNGADHSITLRPGRWYLLRCLWRVGNITAQLVEPSVNVPPGGSFDGYARQRVTSGGTGANDTQYVRDTSSGALHDAGLPLNSGTAFDTGPGSFGITVEGLVWSGSGGTLAVTWAHSGAYVLDLNGYTMAEEV